MKIIRTQNEYSSSNSEWDAPAQNTQTKSKLLRIRFYQVE